MALIRVDKLKEGMVTGKDVFAPTGRLIMKAGTLVAAKHLRLLKSWGVVELDVEGSEGPEEPSYIPDTSMENITKGVAYLDHLFSLCGRKTPVLKELSRLATVRLMKKIGEKGVSAVPEIDEPKKPTSDLEDISGLSISEIIGTQARLFSYSDTYRQIVEVLQSPKSSSAQIASAVEKDTSLSVKLLQIVNSAYYGFPSKISSIQRAVTILGGRELTTLAIGITAVKHFTNVSQKVIDMKKFWRNAVACGVFARLLAGEKRIASEGYFFLAGLISDIGLLLLLGVCPITVESIIQRCSFNKISLPVCEREVLGFSHSLLGASLLEQWGLPPYLVNIVKFKDSPLSSPDNLESSILHVADVLSFAAGYGWGAAMPIPPLDLEGWNRLDISHNGLDPIFSRADRQIAEIMDVFL